MRFWLEPPLVKASETTASELNGKTPLWLEKVFEALQFWGPP